MVVRTLGSINAVSGTTALLMIGFPLVVVVSWVYELTPEGLRNNFV